ncbi:MAG: hypothetical protein JSW43_13290 [Gemmatimonadota bacterium]|nr:MAG: hypothetical protein JSW43_13290 [Gemmatimonadota bacterium]
MAEQADKKSRLLTPFVLGVVAGAFIVLVGPRVLRPYLPADDTPARDELGGVVRAKLSEPDRVLLTIPTAEGTLLATFTENVAEIDLLVVQGDSIALGLSGYEPFVTNPRIARVGTKGSAGAADTVGLTPSQPEADRPAQEPVPPDSL